MEIFDKFQTVSGVLVTLVPYTEKRKSELDAVNAEIEKFMNAQGEKTWDEISVKQKADFWERKARILWKTEKPLTRAFFESPDFEYIHLRSTEQLFLMTQVYL
jgi:hypothetical protein